MDDELEYAVTFAAFGDNQKRIVVSHPSGKATITLEGEDSDVGANAIADLLDHFDSVLGQFIAKAEAGEIAGIKP